MDDEITLLKNLKQRNVQAFSQVFNECNKDMMVIAYVLLMDRSKAYLVVLEIFERLYNTDEVNKMTLPLQAYLNAKTREACGY